MGNRGKIGKMKKYLNNLGKTSPDGRRRGVPLSLNAETLALHAVNFRRTATISLQEEEETTIARFVVEGQKEEINDLSINLTSNPLKADKITPTRLKELHDSFRKRFL